jgi:hypothetical protein
MVFSVSGWITVRKLSVITFTEGFSSFLAVTLVAFSVLFPLCIGIILYHYLLRKKQPVALMKQYGSIIDGVYGVEENHYDMVIMTVLFPMIR